MRRNIGLFYVCQCNGAPVLAFGFSRISKGKNPRMGPVLHEHRTHASGTNFPFPLKLHFFKKIENTVIIYMLIL